MTLHITTLEGGRALSSFRIQQLLPALQGIHDRIDGLSARFIHLVASAEPLSDALQGQIAALLT